jgi:protein-L-isoaspartate(D-aspartate) O-methyltransferase
MTGMTVPDGDPLARTRERMVEQVVSAGRIPDGRIAAALREVPRHLFLPHLPPESAYADDAIVTKRDAEGRPISSSSQPAIMAIMLHQLGLEPGQRVLEIGAGTGYNAALMKHLTGPQGEVVSIDIDPELVEAARGHLATAGYPDVTVVAADGAGGFPAGAPYDRIIATVGVSDLAPAWLDQAAPGARIVVPLDVRGSQLSVAFERDGDRWVSRSIAPCGFMRMRGPQAGPERIVVLRPGLSVMLPDGLTLADGEQADPAAIAGFLDGPPARLATGVRTQSAQVFWGLGLWLATGDRRSVALTEELPGDPAVHHVLQLGCAPLSHRGSRTTMGLLDSAGLAVLITDREPQEHGDFGLQVAGFGPQASALGADLAAHVQAWDQAGQRGVTGLWVEAYPRSSGEQPAEPVSGVPGAALGAVLIERPATRFLVRHT